MVSRQHREKNMSPKNDKVDLLDSNSRTERPLLVHFGAGAIGRSLVGSLFSQAGYDIVFVDADQRVVEALQQRRSYQVVIKDDLPETVSPLIEVRHVTALAADDTAAVAAAVARADLLGTSVGAAVLPHVLRSIATGLKERDRPVSILFCENLNSVASFAAEILQQALGADYPLREQVGLVATSIGKMVPIMPDSVRARDLLEVWGEAYNRIIADGQAFRGPLPAVPGLQLESNFQAHVERKLFVHNLGHAACACHGFLRGHELIAAAMGDPAIAAATRATMEAAAEALTQRYPADFAPADQAEHVADLLRRFANRALGDTVFRVGRDLARKLAPGDRFIGALHLVVETGGDARPICDAIAAALHFAATDEYGEEFPGDAALRDQVATQGVTDFLIRHARLDPVQHAAQIAYIEKRHRQLACGVIGN